MLIMKFLKKSAKKPSYDKRKRIIEGPEIDPVVNDLLDNKTEQDDDLISKKIGIDEYNRTSKEANKTGEIYKVDGRILENPDEYDIEEEAYERILSDSDDRDGNLLRNQAVLAEDIGNQKKADEIWEKLEQDKIRAGRDSISKRKRDLILRAMNDMRSHERTRNLNERKSAERIENLLEKKFFQQNKKIKRLISCIKALSSKMAVNPYHLRRKLELEEEDSSEFWRYLTNNIKDVKKSKQANSDNLLDTGEAYVNSKDLPITQGELDEANILADAMQEGNKEEVDRMSKLPDFIPTQFCPEKEYGIREARKTALANRELKRRESQKSFKFLKKKSRGF